MAADDHLGEQMKRKPYKYGAARITPHPDAPWKGWVDFYHADTGRAGNITETPDQYKSKKEALEAIKGQHPDRKR